MDAKIEYMESITGAPMKEQWIYQEALEGSNMNLCWRINEVYQEGMEERRAFQAEGTAQAEAERLGSSQHIWKE